MLWQCLESEFTVAFQCFRIYVSMPSGDGVEAVTRLDKGAVEHGEMEGGRSDRKPK